MTRSPKPNPSPVASGSPPLHLARPERTGAIEPLLWTFNHVVMAVGVSRRTLERERAARRFPQPDLHIGKRPMWKPSTIRNWIEDQSNKF